MAEVFNPGYPIVHYEEGTQLPSDGTYYVVAGNGVFLHKDFLLMKGFVPVPSVSFLKDMDSHTWAQWKAPKLPSGLVYKIKNFFMRIVETLHAEACTILYYDPDTQIYGVVIPEQQVSHGSVHYRREALTYNSSFIPVGTIHSHCDFGAFHSGTDDSDEETFDGLHITFGHNDQDDFSISASVVMNGHRSPIEPLDVLEGIEKVDGVNLFKLATIPTSGEVAAWDLELPTWLAKVKGLAFRFRSVRD